MKTIEIKQQLVEEALDQLKAAQQDSYVQSTQNVIDELELALSQPPVSGQLPPLHVADKECIKLMKALYPKDRSKKFRR